jgi:hypothetical protein
MASPFVKSNEEVLNRFFLRPEIAVQHGRIGDRTGALFGHELLDRRVAAGGILNGASPIIRRIVRALSIYFRQSSPRHIQHTIAIA